MLNAITILIVCQLIGEVIAQAAGLPLPGPVLGLVLLLGFLVWRGGPSADLESGSRGLLQHLSLLFVPAGVGVMTQLDVIGRELWPILAAILVSTILTLAVTALVMERLAPKEPS